MTIVPTVGRRVHFYIVNPTAGLAVNAGQPLDAGIAAVNNDRSINISFADAVGRMHARENVTLVQEGDTHPAGDYCCWMPYQQGQAKAVDSGLAERVSQLESLATKMASALAELHEQLQNIQAFTPPVGRLENFTFVSSPLLPDPSRAQRDAAAPVDAPAPKAAKPAAKTAAAKKSGKAK